MDSDGKRLCARNSDISTMTIIVRRVAPNVCSTSQHASLQNKRHSPNAAFSVRLSLDHDVSSYQLQRLRSEVNAYALSKPLDWRPGVSMSIALPDGGPPNRVDVLFSLTHHASWQEPGKVSSAYSDLVVAVLEVGF